MNKLQILELEQHDITTWDFAELKKEISQTC
jgi:hypothetical protein